MRRQQSEKDKLLADLQAKNKALEHSVNVFSETTQAAVGTRDVNELVRMAEERRVQQTKEAHAAAVDLIDTMEDWWTTAPPDVRQGLGSELAKVKAFVAVNKEMVDDPEKLKEAIQLTHLFQTFKKHTDTRVANERTKAEAVTSKLSEVQQKFQAEQEKHAKSMQELNRVRQRIALLEQATGQAPPPPASSAVPSGFSGGSFARPGTYIHSRASTNPPPQSSTTSTSVGMTSSQQTSMSAILGNGLAKPGQKRSASDAKLDVKHTQASAGGVSNTTQQGRNTKPRLAYGGGLNLGGFFGSREPATPIPSIMRNLFAEVGASLKSTGLSSNQTLGVKILRQTGN